MLNKKHFINQTQYKKILRAKQIIKTKIKMLRATMKIPSSLALECTLKKMPSTLTDGTIRKTLSVSAANSKRFIINDHYEFDQKVWFIFNKKNSFNFIINACLCVCCFWIHVFRLFLWHCNITPF